MCIHKFQKMRVSGEYSNEENGGKILIVNVKDLGVSKRIHSIIIKLCYNIELYVYLQITCLNHCHHY